MNRASRLAELLEGLRAAIVVAVISSVNPIFSENEVLSGSVVAPRWPSHPLTAQEGVWTSPCAQTTARSVLMIHLLSEAELGGEEVPPVPH